MPPCPVVPIYSPKTPVNTTRMLSTPHSDDTWDRMPYRPLPPYCEVVQINNRTFLSMVSDNQTATYQVAVALTEDECKIYREPPEDMILMKITDTSKVVKAYKPFQDTIAKLRVGKQLPSVRTDQSVTKAITQVMMCDPCPTPCCSQPPLIFPPSNLNVFCVKCIQNCNSFLEKKHTTYSGCGNKLTEPRAPSDHIEANIGIRLSNQRTNRINESMYQTIKQTKIVV